MSLTLQLHRSDTAAEVLVIDGPSKKRFLSVRLGPDVTVYFPGFDHECAEAAKHLAALLLAGAEALEQAQQPAAVA